MGRGRPFNRPPGASLDDHNEQRKAQLEKRQALMSQMAKRAEGRRASAPVSTLPEPRMPGRDVEAYMAALAAQPLHRIGQSEAIEVTPIYERLVRSAAEVAADGSVQVVMPW